jgi:hypothetical protein
LNKKILLYIIVTVLTFVSSSFCLEIDVKAGVQMLSITDFEKKILNISNTLLYAGYTGSIARPTSCFSAEISLGYKIPGLDLRVGPKIKLYPGISYKGSYLYPNGVKAVDYSSSNTLLFLGTGAVYTFMIGTSFGIYAGADLGYKWGFASDKMTTYDTSGGIIGTANTSPSVSGFGYYAKLGAKYYFNPKLALLAEINYNNIGQSFYAGAGISYILGEADDYSKLVQAGNSLYYSKDYSKASEAYLAALKYKKEASIYKNLGNCFYNIKQYAKARWAYELSAGLIEDIQLRQLIEKLKSRGF